MVVRPSLRDEVAEPLVPSGPRALRTELRTSLEDGPATAAPPREISTGRFPFHGAGARRRLKQLRAPERTVQAAGQRLIIGIACMLQCAQRRG
jgi:hypothetical protein